MLVYLCFTSAYNKDSLVFLTLSENTSISSKNLGLEQICIIFELLLFPFNVDPSIIEEEDVGQKLVFMTILSYPLIAELLPYWNH